MRIHFPVFVALLIAVALFLAACGAVATPRPPADPTLEPFTLAPRPTRQATTVSGARATEQPIAVQPTVAPPTETPTSIPPTATATATWTRTPTPLPPTATPVSAGDAAAGEQLFLNGNPQAGVVACVSCHSLSEGQILVGPSMFGIATRAGQRVPGQDAATYLRNSILHPSDFIAPAPEGRTYVDGNGASLMQTQNYDQKLSEEDINNLVAYLLTLE
jgi:cytochrome c553